MVKREQFRQNVLFRGDFQRAALNACVGNNGGPYNLYDYAHGYFESTHQLCQAVTKDHSILVDTIVYPICLNFRHAIELFIKYLITELNKLTRGQAKYKTGHSLDQNWCTAMNLINKAKLKIDEDEIKAIGSAVKCIMEVDRDGTIFRYPESIKGEQHLKDWALVNLGIVDDFSRIIAGIAKNWQGKIDDLIEAAREAGPIA
jgi:hypothetical protein